MAFGDDSTGKRVAGIPVRVVAGKTATNEVGRTIASLPIRYVMDEATTDELGRPIDAMQVEVVAGLTATTADGRIVGSVPVRIVAGTTTTDENGNLVAVIPAFNIGAPLTPWGSLSKTRAAMTMSSSAKLRLKGSVSAVRAAVTISASGTVSDATAVFDPALYPPPTSLAGAKDALPMQFGFEIGVIPITHHIELKTTATNSPAATALFNPAPVVIDTGDIVFPGLASYVPGGPVYNWFRRWDDDLSDYGPWIAQAIKWGDVTAPSLSSPTGAIGSGATADIGVTSDEDEGVLYWAILDDAAPAPTSVAFLAGATGGVASGSTSSPIAGVNSFTAISLPAASPSVTDIVAAGVTDTTGTLTFTVAGGTGTIYWGLSTSATPPILSALIDGTGMAQFGTLAASTGDEVLGLSSMSPTTHYYAYAAFEVDASYQAHFFQRDLSENDSDVESSGSFTLGVTSSVTVGDDFTTAAAAGPVVWDSGNKSSEITLSNSDKTASKSTGATGAFGVKSVQSRDGSEVRFGAVQIVNLPDANNIGICLSSAGVPLNAYSSAGMVIYYISGGQIFPNGGDGISVSSTAQGGTVGWALWRGENDVNVCAFKIGGVWVGGDPVAKTGGYNIGVGGDPVFAMIHFQANGQQVTSVLDTPPSGAIQWEFDGGA